MYAFAPVGIAASFSAHITRMLSFSPFTSKRNRVDAERDQCGSKRGAIPNAAQSQFCPRSPYLLGSQCAIGSEPRTFMDKQAGRKRS